MIYVASMKAPAAVGLPGGVPGLPWVSSERWAAAVNAGLAGKINHAALEVSRSANAGIKV
jgi:hypothetical protein